MDAPVQESYERYGDRRLGEVMRPIVESPLVPEGKALHLRDEPVNRVVSGYRKIGIDVSYLFSGIDSLGVYRCLLSGYEFYYPFDVSGDSEFYQRLERFDWYYMPWKWEHEAAAEYVNDGEQILEVGCGRGGFLRGITERKALLCAYGLELNTSVHSNESSYTILNESIESVVDRYSNKWDCVCSFQVLEHVPAVHQFLKAMVTCLKTGGRLLIGVPNNDSYIRLTGSLLNKPPHHVGLWRADSLAYIAELFPLKLVAMQYEPLQEYHVENYVDATHYSGYPWLVSRLLRRTAIASGRHSSMVSKVKEEREGILGHSILAVFEKT